MKGGAIHFEPT